MKMLLSDIEALGCMIHEGAFSEHSFVGLQ